MTPKEEKDYFNLVSNKIHELRKGETIDFNEKDCWPDVYYKTYNKNLIAIELTELLEDQKVDKKGVRQQDTQEEKLRDYLFEYLKESDIPQNFLIDVLLNHQETLKKEEARDIAKYLSKFLTERIQSLDFKEFKGSKFICKDLEKKKVYSISITFCKEIKEINLNVGSSGVLINEIEKEEIKKIISKKDKKINPCKFFNEAWLVIIATRKAATWRENLEKLNKYLFESKYDKVFVFSFIHDQIIPLKLKNY